MSNIFKAFLLIALLSLGAFAASESDSPEKDIEGTWKLSSLYCDDGLGKEDEALVDTWPKSIRFERSGMVTMTVTAANIDNKMCTVAIKTTYSFKGNSVTLQAESVEYKVPDCPEMEKVLNTLAQQGNTPDIVYDFLTDPNGSKLFLSTLNKTANPLAMYCDAVKEGMPSIEEYDRVDN